MQKHFSHFAVRYQEKTEKKRSAISLNLKADSFIVRYVISDGKLIHILSAATGSFRSPIMVRGLIDGTASI